MDYTRMGREIIKLVKEAEKIGKSDSKLRKEIEELIEKYVGGERSE